VSRTKLLLIAGIILLLLIIIAFFVLFTNASFSETNGRVVYPDGAPIEGAKVTIGYSCKVPAVVESQTRNYGSARAITNANGEFSFSPIHAGLKFLNTECHKTVSAFKEGYCGDISRCKTEIQYSPGLSEGQLREADEYYLLNYKGKYYESAYFEASKWLYPDENSVIIQLNPLE
jgi:hypothetical protein